MIDGESGERVFTTLVKSQDEVRSEYRIYFAFTTKDCKTMM